MTKWIISFFLIVPVALFSQDDKQWVTYPGASGPGKGKHIVWVTGDEEYRSEEALTMMAKILSENYGFTSTVLFSVDSATGMVDANLQTNIPGLEQLRKADLMVIFTRFRELPDSQMKYIDEYIMAGKPVIGMRTATHAFDYSRNKKSPYAKYSYNSKIKGWENGFGKKILGETWIDHHGHHGKEGARGLIDGIQQAGGNPILNGVKDIWVPSDVYSIKYLEPGATVLVHGMVTSGMTPDSPPNLSKSVMPVAWTKYYTTPQGKKGKVFTTTMGASVDLQNEDLRRLITNACFWATGLENKIPKKAKVDYIGEYSPTMFGFESFQKTKKPAAYK